MSGTIAMGITLVAVAVILSLGVDHSSGWWGIAAGAAILIGAFMVENGIVSLILEGEKVNAQGKR